MARRVRTLGAVAPELRTGFDLVPVPISNRVLLAHVRRQLVAVERPVDGVRVTRYAVPVPDGTRTLVTLHEPTGEGRLRGAVLWLHGGGTLMGRPEVDHAWCGRLARELGVLVAAVDYRLAPEHPFPAALDDCLAALHWLRERLNERNAPVRVALGGASAGGLLAAATAQRALDEGVAGVCFQLLQYPMLDDRTVRRPDHPARGRVGWTPRSNRFAWRSYLGHEPGSAIPPAYAVPARRADLAGLPPAWIGVGDLDLFRDESTDYAERLAAAGVAVELHVEPRMHHGADVMADLGVGSMQRFRQRMVDALDAALG
ncbi:alpha/beta hydrolase [Nocardioides massiliensis]|uniref:Acetyl esterase/lipase n=1 Tax=Nocardioides massiliensis TaxID=1325935 RepID=A0ABT9NU32_9ACTN|nr:alpha/beta hydrolase [Nocardioides massiliensis]MDP9823924.1 acetyl esterase/lipase [Nocardioides massiliensis]